MFLIKATTPKTMLTAAAKKQMEPIITIEYTDIMTLEGIPAAPDMINKPQPPVTIGNSSAMMKVNPTKICRIRLAIFILSPCQSDNLLSVIQLVINQAYRYQCGYTLLLHGNTVQAVRSRHGTSSVGNDNELGILGHFV